MSKNLISKVMGIILPLFTTVLGVYLLTTVKELGKGFDLMIWILIISSWYAGYLLLDRCKHCKWNITLYFDWILSIGIVRVSSVEFVIMLPFIALQFEIIETNTNRFTFKNSLW